MNIYEEKDVFERADLTAGNLFFSSARYTFVLIWCANFNPVNEDSSAG
jgi:hypothetical protein